jgi:hypothetical protein
MYVRTAAVDKIFASLIHSVVPGLASDLRPESLAFWALAKALHMFRRLCFFPIVDCTRVRPS